MNNEDFLKDVCPNHTEKSKWNKSELLHILELHKEAITVTRCSTQLKDKYKTIDDIITLADLHEAYPNENNLKILTVNDNLLYFVGNKVIKTRSL